jgi:predicted small lipoprotein YifL
MLKSFLKISVVIFLFSAFACSKKTKDDPLILPPNFAEKPDPNQQEKPVTPEQQQENVARLKDLLLKNDE